MGGRYCGRADLLGGFGGYLLSLFGQIVVNLISKQEHNYLDKL